MRSDFLFLAMLVRVNSYMWSGSRRAGVARVVLRLGLSTNAEDDGKGKDPPSSQWKTGQSVKVKVMQFGPLGASVLVDGDEGLSATGLILQSEIAYFRQGRGGEDVVVGEQLDAFVGKVREDGKLNVALRPIGVHRRIDSVQQLVLDALEGSPSGTIPIGDKSSPTDITSYIHGISKLDFKNAVGALYRAGIVKPGEFQTELVPEDLRPSKADDPAVGSNRGKALAGLLGGQKRPVRDDAKVIFVGNLPFTVNEKILENVVTKAVGSGKVAKIRLVMDEVLKKPRGYAFLELLDETMVPEAVEALSGLEVMGRKIRVDFSRPSDKMRERDEGGNVDVDVGGNRGNDGGREEGNFSSRPPISPSPSPRSQRSNSGEFSVDDLFEELGSEQEGGGVGGGAQRAERPMRSDDRDRGRDRDRDRDSGRERDKGRERERESVRDRGRERERDGDNRSSRDRFEATLFIGNLPYAVDEDVLRQEVERVAGPGSVARARIAVEKDTGRKRGFGYVDIYKRDVAQQVG